MKGVSSLGLIVTGPGHEECAGSALYDLRERVVLAGIEPRERDRRLPAAGIAHGDAQEALRIAAAIARGEVDEEPAVGGGQQARHFIRGTGPHLPPPRFAPADS